MAGETDQFGLPPRAVAQLRDAIASCPKVRAAAIYGSRAKGSHRPGSDIDIVLDGETLTLSDQFAIENRIDDLLLPWTVDLSLHSLIDNPQLLEHIQRVGVEFYCRGPV